ncbi:MAG: hypothetical protein AAF242_20235, partial [Bacteroidota bacterium]
SAMRRVWCQRTSGCRICQPDQLTRAYNNRIGKGPIRGYNVHFALLESKLGLRRYPIHGMVLVPFFGDSRGTAVEAQFYHPNRDWSKNAEDYGVGILFCRPGNVPKEVGNMGLETIPNLSLNHSHLQELVIENGEQLYFNVYEQLSPDTTRSKTAQEIIQAHRPELFTRSDDLDTLLQKYIIDKRETILSNARAFIQRNKEMLRGSKFVEPKRQLADDEVPTLSWLYQYINQNTDGKNTPLITDQELVQILK